MDAALSVARYPVAPLHDLIIVRRDPPDEKVGALFMPGGVGALERRSMKGNPATVLRVGPGGWREGRDGKLRFVPTTLVEGERVLLGFHPGLAVPDEQRPGQHVHFIAESEIKGKLE